MAGNIQFKRGLKSNLPLSAPSGTPLWCEDSKELYIGTGQSIEKVGEQTGTGGDSQAATDGDGNVITTTYEKINKKIIQIQNTSSYRLEDNKIYRLTLIREMYFILPTITDNTIFHQILIQVTMPQVQYIDLSTSSYLNSIEPNMSQPGNYNIIYEAVDGIWYVGVLKKMG